MTPADRNSALSRLAPLALVLLGLAAYSNTFRAEFVFDDFPHIVESPLVRDLGYFVHPERVAESGASEVARGSFAGRRLVLLTFALNYRLHGLDVRGYHAVNLAIHLLAALALFGTVRRTLALPRFDASALRPHETAVAFFAAAIFTVHPLQTQAVTYIVQRMASLAGLLCILSLYAFLRFRSQGNGRARWIWYSLSIASLLAAMASKENAAAFPFVLGIFELSFFAGPLRRRLACLAPILSTAALVPARLLAGGASSTAALGSALESVRAHSEVSRLEYLYTQFGVVVTYLRLLLWPAGQNLDPDPPLRTHPWQPQVLVPLVLLMALAACGVWLLRRSQSADPGLGLIGFGILWFFLTLAVESSVVPIADRMVEHRLYLPTAGFAIACVAAVFRVRAARGTPRRLLALGIVVLLFAGAAFARNAVWRTRLSIWQDTADKSPNKARPQILAAGALADAGRTEEAIARYRRALAIDGTHYRAWTNLGNLLLESGRPDPALEAFDRAVAIQPADRFAHNSRGITLRTLGRRPEAIEAYRQALMLDPSYIEARNNLGNLWRELGRPDIAVAELETALRLDPSNPVIRRNLELARAEAGIGARGPAESSP